ncbi:hypothetical protein CTAYLR_005778 [Chrysophaeum taylorii]|uniref:RBR-type E3 ubiquitin transferase n=1 Tax=Chrysophaeum taylorii TaxID=2483200 RepID=A0AAD7UM66_9STRA|nr:hypothetical protein CTAYLR_005778 [Chrysophaeum taylorii]
MESVKVVLVGNGAVGKTCLVVKRTTGAFPEEYVPTVYDVPTMNSMIDGTPTNVTLWDTAGQFDFDRLRPLVYPQTDAFVLCASLDDENSQDVLESRWLHEIRAHLPARVPFVIAATKADVSGSSLKLMERAKRMKAQGYFEVSAREDWGVDTLFDHVARVALWHVRAQRSGDFSKKRRFWFRKKKLAPPSFVTNFHAARLATVDCGICFEKVSRDATNLRACCGSRFCKTCLSTYIRTQVQEGRSRIACPGRACRRMLNPADVRALADADTNALYSETLAKNHADRLGTVRENDKLKPDFDGTRICPACQVIIFRHSGCDQVRCACGHNFNWNQAETVFY